MGAGRPRLFEDSLLRVGQVAPAGGFSRAGAAALSDNDALLSEGLKRTRLRRLSVRTPKAARGADATGQPKLYGVNKQARATHKLT